MTSIAHSSPSTYLSFEPSSPGPSSSPSAPAFLPSSTVSEPRLATRRPPPLPRTVSDMDISDPSEDEQDCANTSIATSERLIEQEEQPEDELGVPPLLAAKLASALLHSVLFTSGQIPTTVQQLIRQADPNSSRSSTPTTTAPKRPSYLPTRPSPPSLLLPLLTQLTQALHQAFLHLSTLAQPRTPPPVVMFLTGPSLLLPKAMFGVQLPPLTHEQPDRGHDAREWDAVERAVLRGLVGMRAYGRAGGDGVAPSKTHILLLAPRSFSPPSSEPESSSAWLPRQTLSPRLSSLLFASPPPPPPPPPSSSSSRPKAMIKKKPKGPEVEFIRVVRGREGVKVEDARGTRVVEDGEGQEGEMIWWMWEGGVVEGWREK